jgi:hypothetical protein
MRAAIATALTTAATGVVLLAFVIPTATAEPTAPPEVPPGGVVFTDNPAIVDPHPIPVESWSRAGAENAVAVNFTSGTDTCYGVHATAQETSETVTVDLQSGMLPGAVNRPCIMIALFGTLEVPLQGPLGDRQVFSAS